MVERNEVIFLWYYKGLRKDESNSDHDVDLSFVEFEETCEGF